jgi:hypothetical protein
VNIWGTENLVTATTTAIVVTSRTIVIVVTATTETIAGVTGIETGTVILMEGTTGLIGVTVEVHSPVDSRQTTAAAEVTLAARQEAVVAQPVTGNMMLQMALVKVLVSGRRYRIVSLLRDWLSRYPMVA